MREKIGKYEIQRKNEINKGKMKLKRIRYMQQTKREKIGDITLSWKRG